jgi:hypothetical protein
MTEAEWLSSTDPAPMLEFLRGRVSDRKLRLFAVAGCRRFGNFIVFDEQRQAITAAEQFADGKLTANKMKAAAEAMNLGGADEAKYACWYACQEDAHEAAVSVTRELCHCAASAVEISLEESGPEGPALFGTPEKAEAEERAFVAGLLREIVGLPFRGKSRIKSEWLAWNDATVPRIARAIYEDSGFDNPPIMLDTSPDEAVRAQAALCTRLAQLGDALEDAGCTDTELLGHLRGPGPHVRGCWAVDLVMGKQ